MLNSVQTASKLEMYKTIKREFCYSNYLNIRNPMLNILTKFRMSLHWLPIERGRYIRPKIPRHERLRLFCNLDVGSEFHVFMECKHKLVEDLRSKYLNKMNDICPPLRILPNEQKFIYIMSCCDRDLIPPTIDWVKYCNEIHKNNPA